MKCPYCGGTGKEIIFTNVGKCIAVCLECNGKGVIEPMTKKDYCNNCWGTGKVPDFWDETKNIICPRCNGSGKEPQQTNDEWRKICSEEEFAEALTKVVLNIVAWNNDPKPSEVRNTIKVWLKQSHQGE